ncbi:MAG: DUF2017 family protein [Streptosporangiales bacterium]|nr:DUF2017 family protein [Streptosporangiales bacterium]
MTRGFKRTRDGRVSVRLSTDEVGLLRELVEQVLDMVDGDESGEPSGTGERGERDPGGDDLAAMLGIREAARPPDDPVLARLFPDGYRGDEASAAEFRRYTEEGLRESKRTAAGEILAATARGEGGTFVLEPEEADSWLRAINDIRLALGTRLDVSEDAHEELSRMDPSDSRYPGYVAYDWLSFLQETLVRALW